MVNIGSITVLIGMANILPYVASKAGVIGLTRAMAREVGPLNVRVNTRRRRARSRPAASAIHPDPEGYSRFVLDQQSLKRRGTPEDLADVVAFMASDRSVVHHRADHRGLRRLGALVSLFGSPGDRESLRRLVGRAEQVVGRGGLHARRRHRARRAGGAPAHGRDRLEVVVDRALDIARGERARHARVVDLADRHRRPVVRRPARLGAVPHVLRRPADDLRPRAHAGAGRGLGRALQLPRAVDAQPSRCTAGCRRRRRACWATASTGTRRRLRSSCEATCGRPTCSARCSRWSASCRAPLGGRTIADPRPRAQRGLRARRRR